jgi:hypothetical protein
MNVCRTPTEAITLLAEIRSQKKGEELVLPNLINAELSAIPLLGNSDYSFSEKFRERFLWCGS